ncbi:putative O-glycosylation ligase (exosortase A-associated) [Duganella sp. 1411]|uniref:putative O-glycosylation ligase, exosortase A system-associated n=1 Tax=Duganella sp. 1411 TaxID=2806572 RepID=UPI001AE774B5|nr:putative O-glycosylation ligase, exosortase A system-associated [Duganella sp. 1411]MBP1202278.1 putative O-glycosylation ligase (exosortase A-associated) [Duganella sp. 1411]
MRDLLVTLLVFGSLPYIFKRPSFGVVMWIWISVMNPHSQGWGFARTFPFAAVIAATIVAAMVLHKDKFRLPAHPVTWVFLGFMGWMSVTSLFSIHGVDVVTTQWIKVYKIFGMTAVVMMLVRTRQEIEWLVWTVVVSLGFYGVKGGIFTLRSGGNFRVWGPEGTFIDGNNEVALALVVVIPLMYYLIGNMRTRWAKGALLAAILLCALASLGSYSRGAALAIGAMTIVLWLKSQNKAPLGVLLALAVPLLVLLMPSQWHERIDTINTYQEDSSAMGRINAWRMAFNLANDRLLGGGFEIYDGQVFARYAPIPLDVHAAHSIYFQVLGEHGWIGLALYLALGVMVWRTGAAIVRQAAGVAELQWALRLATMLQVSLVGFAVGGAFLSLAYFDVPYLIMTAMVATRMIVARQATPQRPLAARRADLHADAGVAPT